MHSVPRKEEKSEKGNSDGRNSTGRVDRWEQRRPHHFVDHRALKLQISFHSQKTTLRPQGRSRQDSGLKPLSLIHHGPEAAHGGAGEAKSQPQGPTSTLHLGISQEVEALDGSLGYFLVPKLLKGKEPGPSEQLGLESQTDGDAPNSAPWFADGRGQHS